MLARRHLGFQRVRQQRSVATQIDRVVAVRTVHPRQLVVVGNVGIAQVGFVDVDRQRNAAPKAPVGAVIYLYINALYVFDVVGLHYRVVCVFDDHLLCVAVTAAVGSVVISRPLAIKRRHRHRIGQSQAAYRDLQCVLCLAAPGLRATVGSTIEIVRPRTHVEVVTIGRAHHRVVARSHVNPHPTAIGLHQVRHCARKVLCRIKRVVQTRAVGPRKKHLIGELGSVSIEHLCQMGRIRLDFVDVERQRNPFARVGPGHVDRDAFYVLEVVNLMACTGVSSAVIGHHPGVVRVIRRTHRHRVHRIRIGHLDLKCVLPMLAYGCCVGSAINLGVARSVAEVV